MTFPDDIFAGRRFGVVGLGRNGLPVARALAAMGAEVIAWDDSAEARTLLPLPLREGVGGRGGPQHGSLHIARPDPANIDALILSPGIPHRLPKAHPIASAARAAGVPILSDADLLYRAVRAAGSRARFAGVTGTNGKSTTTALLAHVLQTAGIPAAAGGNLGTPALALPLLPQDGVYVLEMSSYMLERLAVLTFDVAAMLNLSPDHLDRHGDMAGYAAAKAAIFDRQAVTATAVVGTDDSWSRAMAEMLDSRATPVIRISAAHGPHWMLADAPALPGAHNAQNAAAVLAMARALGVPDEATARGMATFPGLPHRQERAGCVDGIGFVNDSKATNADSAACALACYDRVVWIAGGMAKAGGIAPLAPFFPRIARALLIGRDAPLLADTLRSHGVAFEDAGTLDEAVPAALAAARATGTETVLLSPACASFDQFTGFDQRGDRFRTLVAGLAAASGAA